MDKKVTIYSTSTCPYCKKAKQFLSEKGIAFEDFDVVADPAAYEKMKEISGGARSVPVIQICDKVMVGFSESEIQEALKCLEQ